MTSNINPNNINGAYPVAGQDNNSQGFRDNFTNTKTNFQYAANEISDLQSKAIVSSQLVGGAALATQNNMMGSPLIDALVSDISTPAVALGTLTGTVPIDFSAGHYQAVTTGGSISLEFTNWPVTGQYGSVTVAITVTNIAYTVTFPTAVNVHTAGIVGLNGITNVMTFHSPGIFIFTFSTSNNGSSVILSENNPTLRQYNTTSQTFTATTNTISPGTTYSIYFPSPISQAGTATLPNGVAGQVKVIGNYSTGGLTVTGTFGLGYTTAQFSSQGAYLTVVWSSITNQWLPTSSFGSVTVS